jgi:hypothetical protein
MNVLHVPTTPFSVILWPTQEQTKCIGDEFHFYSAFLLDVLFSLIFQHILFKLSQTMCGTSFHLRTIPTVCPDCGNRKDFNHDRHTTDRHSMPQLLNTRMTQYCQHLSTLIQQFDPCSIYRLLHASRSLGREGNKCVNLIFLETYSHKMKS